MRRFNLLFLLIFCLGCGDDPDSALTHRWFEVAYGTPDDGHPQAGKIPGCSSTLIGRQTVLTAGHCIWDPQRKTTFTTRGVDYVSSSITVHPDYLAGDADSDLAIIRLKDRVPGIIPARVPSIPPTVEEAITLVGFGQIDSSNLAGVKYKGTNKIFYVASTVFTFLFSKGSGVCSGDSGGPSFAVRNGVEWLIGVHSRATYPCGNTSGSAIDERTDAFYTWIKTEARGDLYGGEFIDDKPPTVTITSPASGVQVPPSFTVEATASDNVGVARVELHLNGLKQESLEKPPYRFKVQNLYRTTHTIKVVAVDAEQNQGAAELPLTIEEGQPFGAACDEDMDCTSGLCLAEGSCTRTCDVLRTCPEGYTCGDGTCTPIVEEGCRSAPGRPATNAGLWLLLVLVLLGRRRWARAGIRTDR